MATEGVVTIQVLFFASAKEAAGGVSQVELALDAHDATTADVRNRLAALYPRLADLVLDERSITFAVNEEYLAPNQVLTLKNGDTVALIPPISGG